MDVEQFIELVRERPCLYDYKDALSKNKKEKEKNWKEIAATMEITSELAKSKWKNLKDNYSKHLKGITASSGHYLKYLHWAWAPNMEFMKKHVNFASAATSLDQNQQDDHETEHADSAQSSSRSDDRFEEIPVENKKRVHTHVSRHELRPRTHRVYQYMENGHNDGYDATDLIFLGYAKAIKSFSIRRQAEIKLRIAKIVTDEEVAHYEENSAYPESPGLYSQSPSPQNDPLNSKISQDIQVKNEEI